MDIIVLIVIIIGLGTIVYKTASKYYNSGFEKGFEEGKKQILQEEIQRVQRQIKNIEEMI